MKASTRIFLVLGATFLLALGIYYFTTSHTQALMLVGTVDAHEVIVSSRIQGQIASLDVVEGDRVRAGQLIATIAAHDLAALRRAALATVHGDRFKVAEARAALLQVEQATASQVVAAQAQARAARAAVVQAQAQYARQNADTRRAVELARAGIFSQQTHDEMVAALNADRAAIHSARATAAAQEAALQTAEANRYQVEMARQTVAADQAQLRNAEALAAQAQVQLGYAQIHAPVTGVVNLRVALPGEVVAPAAPIVTIEDLSRTWVYAPLPETYADSVPLGDKLRVVMPSGAAVWGTVIAKAALAGFATQRDVSRRKRDIKTVQLKLLIPNPGMRFVPGMIADVFIPSRQLVHP